MITKERAGTDYWHIFYADNPEDPLRQIIGHCEGGRFFVGRFFREHGIDIDDLPHIANLAAESVSEESLRRG